MGRSEWGHVLWVGLLEASVALGLYWYLLGELDAIQARNFLFTAVVFSQILRAFGARSTTRIFWEVGAFSNVWLLGVAVVTGFLQLSLHYFPLSQEIFGLRPLSLADMLFIMPFAFIPITVIELKKLVHRLLMRTRPSPMTNS
jgi:P-type Ca2+ transporter type 2C